LPLVYYALLCSLLGFLFVFLLAILDGGPSSGHLLDEWSWTLLWWLLITNILLLLHIGHEVLKLARRH
jgi:hypothetical protein